MQLSANPFVNDFAKSALIGCVYILITVLWLKLAGSPFLGYYFEASFNLGKFRCCKNAGFLVCPGEGNTTVNVLSPEPGIVRKRFIVLNEQRILTA